MGLIKAALGSAGGVLGDQWKEYFYCEAIPADTIMVKGKKKVTARSSNTHGEDNIITNGSVIAVADGQCMIIVEQGRVVDICAEPGSFTYDSSTEPSIFSGGSLATNIKEVFANVGKRFTFGGVAANDQRVYYINTKELIGNKYGTPGAVPFRVVDERAGIDIDVSVKCFGEYSYRISNPILFYTNVCGNTHGDYKRATIDGQLKSEFLTKLQPAFAKISAMGIRYSQLLAHTDELGKIMKEQLTAEWEETRGIEIVKVGVSSVKADEEDEKMLKEMQKTAGYANPALAAALNATATADAMKMAAQNQGGAAMAFMGMNMAQQMGGNNTAQLFQMAQQQQAVAPQAAPAPAADAWKCACGATVSGNFCPECGAKKPAAANAWTCSCGAVNQGKFCSTCGAKKPEGVPQYKCDKCGWVPEDPTNPPKFCPQCGDPFGDEDIV